VLEQQGVSEHNKCRRLQMAVQRAAEQHLWHRSEGGEVRGQLLHGFQQARSFRILAAFHSPLKLICKHQISAVLELAFVSEQPFA
jgi:hypothetical protein